MFENLVYDSTLNKQKKTIAKSEYEVFCKEFIFDSLSGETFGQSFCRKFKITDNLLNLVSSDSEAKYLIETLGYIK
jgi:hypothetical protein